MAGGCTFSERNLTKFYNFVNNYLKRFPKFYPEIKDKNICFEIVDDKKIKPIKVVICMKNGKFKKKVRTSFFFQEIPRNSLHSLHDPLPDTDE